MGSNPDKSDRWQTWIKAIALLCVLLVTYHAWRTHRENSQDGVILVAASRYGVEPALVKAIVWRESWFDPWARGRAGEIGLMQVGESAAREWADAEHIPFFVHSQLFDPAKNTLAGTWYLSRLLQHFAGTDNPLPYALAAYNAGRVNALKWAQGAAVTNSALFINQIGFPRTKNYVEAVINRFEHYRPIFPPPGATDDLQTRTNPGTR
jgi:soluble lytic murein transglycosylase